MNKIKIEILAVDFDLLKVGIAKTKNDFKIYDLEFYLNNEDFIIDSSPELVEDFQGKGAWILQCIEKLTKKDSKCKQFVADKLV